jgi:hypothetical protein
MKCNFSTNKMWRSAALSERMCSCNPGGVNKALKQRLAAELGLDFGVVANWFSARCIKARRESGGPAGARGEQAVKEDGDTVLASAAAVADLQTTHDPLSAAPAIGGPNPEEGAPAPETMHWQTAEPDIGTAMQDGLQGAEPSHGTKRIWISSERYKQASPVPNRKPLFQVERIVRGRDNPVLAVCTERFGRVKKVTGFPTS